jgi:hypothetical protein
MKKLEMKKMEGIEGGFDYYAMWCNALTVIIWHSSETWRIQQAWAYRFELGCW